MVRLEMWVMKVEILFLYAKNNKKTFFMDNMCNRNIIPSRQLFLIALAGLIIFFIACEELDVKRVVKIETQSYSDVTTNSATIKGAILDAGEYEIIAYGHCWSKAGNPDINDDHSTLPVPAARGTFQSVLTGLEPNTSYTYNTYATNIKYTVYGRPFSFITGQNITLPVVTTSSPTNISVTSATVGGNVTSDGGATVTERGVYWGTSPNPETTGTKKAIGSGTGIFEGSLTGLSPNTSYYIKAYAINAQGTAYGNQVSFTAGQSITSPNVTTSVPANISKTSATVGGNVTSDGGATVTERGVYWGTSPNPEATGTKKTIGSGTGIFEGSLTGLSPNTTYYIKAYAINTQGPAYGDQVNLTTDKNITVPDVTTSTPTNISETSATVGGNVTSDGGATVTERGVYWGTSPNPETTGTKKTIGSGTGIFEGSLTGLASSTPYYVKAYAINSQGIVYGNQVGFTTGINITTPSVTTSTPTNISETSATVGGNVTSDGGATVTERGVYWGTSPNPETTGTKKTIGSGTGIFEGSLTGLASSTPYYVKAYAINSQGTVYGNQVGFTTGIAITTPSVTTSTPTGITGTSATVGGNVTSDGGATVTERGIYWGTSPNPETTGTKKTIGSGTGIFEGSLTGLASSTFYYVKAYAINSQGPAYGSEVSFKTSFQCGTSFTDPRNGESYATVAINTQCWMARNLNIGTRINGSVEMTNQGILEKYCFNDNTSNCDVYGALYQWDEMMQYTTTESTKGICPDGWHLPSDYEWKVLEVQLGMSSSASDLTGWRGTNEGGKLKEIGTAHWQDPNTGASDLYGFKALPGGYRWSDGSFYEQTKYGSFWSSTFNVSTASWERYIAFDRSDINRNSSDKHNAIAVRCIKD
jgi:uncharacterized protein (TIGR02145 family)